MINRVTEAIKFNMITNSMFNIQTEYGKLMEKLSTQKMINRPSDDPIGTNNILNFRTAINTIQQYQTNITDADISLSVTETVLTSIRKVVADAEAIAISEAGTGSAETMDISAATVSALIDEALSLMNTKQSDSYLFSGSKTDTQPFTAAYRAASIGTVVEATTNTYDGNVSVSGTYIGTENKNYAVRIVDGGAPGVATYQVSSDGGKTWGSNQVGHPVNVGDGITMTFAGGTLSVGDFFTVDGNTGGYYNGNDDAMTVQIGKDNNLVYNITGADAFTGPSAFASPIVPDPPDLTAGDTIVLTRDTSVPAGWTLSHTNNTAYTTMAINSATSNTITIDSGVTVGNDITVSLSGKWNEGDTATFTITPKDNTTIPPTPLALSAVSVQGSGTVDLLGTLYALKDALSAHDTDLISAQTERLQTLETQVLQSETLAGAKRSSLELAGSNHKTIDLQITNMLADIENADLTQLITEFQMKQIAMQASYSMASKIGEMTIMNYL